MATTVRIEDIPPLLDQMNHAEAELNRARVEGKSDLHPEMMLLRQALINLLCAFQAVVGPDDVVNISKEEEAKIIISLVRQGGERIPWSRRVRVARASVHEARVIHRMLQAARFEVRPENVYRA